jgi:PAS domain S-box-containing protein
METFITILQSLTPIAKEMPWFLITVFLVWGAYKVGKFLADKLFDKEEGLVVNFFASQNSFIESMKEHNTRTTLLLEKSNDTLKELKDHQIKVLASVDENSDQIKLLKTQIIESINRKENDKNLFTVLVDDTSLPIIFTDKTLKVTRVNTAFCLLLGYTGEELTNKYLKDIVIEKNNSSDDILLSKVIGGEVDRYRMEKTFISKTNENISVAIHLFRHPKTGEFQSFIGMVFPLHHNHIIN